EWIHQVGQEVSLWGPIFVVSYQGLLLLQALARQDTARAVSHAHEIERLGFSVPNEEVLARVVAAYAYHAARSDDEARTHLEQALTVASACGSPYLEWVVRLAQAHCAFNREQI